MNLAEAFGGKFKGHEIKTAVSDVYDEKMNQETRIKQYIPVEPEKVLQIEPEKKVEQIQIKKESKKESKNQKTTDSVSLVDTMGCMLTNLVVTMVSTKN